MLRWGVEKSSSVDSNDKATHETTLQNTMLLASRLETDDPDILTATSSSVDDPHNHLHHDRDDQLQSPLSHEEEKKYEIGNDSNDLRDSVSGNFDDDNNQRSPSTESDVAEDDDGGDHAEDPPIPWLPQNVHSTCEFTHTIRDYASKRESGCKKAEYSPTTVDEYGNRWRLIVYVNGNGRASNHHLSLFLQVADAEDLPFGWKKAVSYVLTLEHPKGPTLCYAKRNPDKTFKLCPKAIDWGWSQFITADRIQQEGFVADDSLIVRASVTVKSSSVSVDEEDAELYLKCAVEEGDVEAVKLCLEHGASVNCKFKDDLYTPLHTACSSGNSDGSMEVLNLLLDEGADGNACNKWKETPLLIAANNGHRAAVEALLRHGANPSLCSEAGWSALTFAAHKGYDDIVSLLLRAGAPVNCPVTEDASTPLHKACAGAKPGHLASVKALLAKGADVHALNKWRETPLLTAANHGQAGAVDILLQAGADPCKCTDTGWSPLSIASYKGHDDVVKLLLEEGAPTEEEDPTLSALLQAATKGLPDTVALLLKHGADHTVTTKKGDTALSILVEQNLIDAAVEMVTVHNASIPRCSRDRKKVQRARLLINLRMKQLESGGRNTGDATGDTSESDDQNYDLNDSHDGDGEHGHVSGLQTSVSATNKKNKRDKKALSESAEEKARAAEEALLLELEMEESKAMKERAEANSKRQKKKEKKERDRQEKLKIEQVLREKEEKERLERDRQKKEKEEKERRERELFLFKQKQQEEKEQLEREKILAAKRKEREERQLRERQQQEREQRIRMEKQKKEEAASKSDLRTKRSKPKQLDPATSTSASNGPSFTTNRRWEKQEISASQSSQQSTHSDQPEASAIHRGFVSDYHSQAENVNKVPLSRTSENSGHAHGLHQFVTSDHSHRAASRSQEVSSQFTIEHPAICLYRREKVLGMITRCTQLLAAVDGSLVKSVIYRWMIRASHDSSPFLDPIIPSWNDHDQVVTFFQRQLIAENRKSGSAPLSMEILKDSGASMAMYCLNLARELDQFRHQIESHLPGHWTDAELGMTVSENARHNEGTVTIVSWANRAQVQIPRHVFSQLKERFNGPKSRFLAAVFMAKMWYETRTIITDDTAMGYRIPPQTKQLALGIAQVSEVFSDPFCTEPGCAFWGTFEVVDKEFGGFNVFPKYPSCDIYRQLGALTFAFLPLDPPVAAKYTQHMVDILICPEASNTPISFFVIAHSSCFHDNANAPSDLYHLDPRLYREHQDLVRLIECLQAGQHAFYSGSESGVSKVCNAPSLLFVLQNSYARAMSEFPDAALSNLIGTIKISSLGYQNDLYTEGEASHSFLRGLASNAVNRHLTSHDYGAIGGESIPQPFSPHDMNGIVSRRGRLFELVDNGEEEVGDDIVAGVLENLGVGLFQDNAAAEVDIEAISLMGFGEMPNAGLSSQVHKRFNMS